MNTTEKRNFVRNLLNSTKGTFFTAEFIGVDGKTPHKFNGRLGVFKYSNGGKNYAANCDHLMTGFNVQKMNYRNLNLDGITRISAGGQTYTF